MIFDTDILIFIQRGNRKALQFLDKQEERFISAQSYMELLQCAQNKTQLATCRDFLRAANITTLPINEKISNRAAIYVEEYSLSHHMRAGDAIIGATAAESNLTLATANTKHFKAIQDIKLKPFKP